MPMKLRDIKSLTTSVDLDLKNMIIDLYKHLSLKENLLKIMEKS